MLSLNWLAYHAEYAAGKTALALGGTRQGMTYAECHATGLKLAAFLRDRFEVRKGDRVAVLAFNSVEHFLLLFAARVTGFILVPLNHRLTATELSAVIREIQPRLFIHGAEFDHVAEELRNGGAPQRCASLEVEMGAGHGFDEFLADGTDRPESAEVDEDHPAMLLYTSGSEGQPKGVVVTHGMLQWNAIHANVRLDLSADDTALVPLPLHHTGGWNALATPLLFRGGTVIIQQKFDPAAVLRSIGSGEVTLLVAVPTMLRRLAAHPHFERTSFSRIRYIIVGGEPLPASMLDIWQVKGVTLRQSFGMTEAGPGCFTVPVRDARRKATSVGIPNMCLSVRLVDGEGRDVPQGETGELVLAGPVVTPGYWKGPDRLEPVTRGGWFYTGDLMTRDRDGFFYVAGRKKDLIISGGENISPLEIERVLRGHPAVAEAAVVSAGDEQWGETGVGFVVANDASLSAGSLGEFCRKHLAAYKVPPVFRVVDELPRTPGGKVDRRALRHLAAAARAAAK